MSTQSVTDLLGENVTELGEDMVGPDLYAGYLPDRSLVLIPQTIIGDGLGGPPNDQQLAIFRVEQEDTVYPMVAAGAALHDMIRRPSPIVETADDE